MNDDITTIFTDDDSVDKEIEENEARSGGPHRNGIERTLETVVAPIARVLRDRELTPEEEAEVDRQNDRDQNA